MDENSENRSRKDKAKKMLVWLGVASIAMFFAAFTSAYIVLQADHFWVQSELPKMFMYSTVILMVSSLTIYLAKRSTISGNTGGLKLWLSITLLLGVGFTITQYLGWNELQEGGKFFIGTLDKVTGEYGEDYVILMRGEPLLFDNGNYYRPGDIDYAEPINDRINDTFNISASFLYLLSGLHVLHLIGGFIWLLVLIAKSFAGKITAQNLLPLELGSIYWHFLDILWLYLFLFLLLIR